jgi:LysM repeat protein/ABC-type branched-subunit amino acid transport system substrate-binding protein
MKTSLRLLIVFLAFIISAPLVLAQTNSDIEITKNKVLIAGKVYYVHTVQKGQTLYSIAKAYHVTQQQIIDENPEAGFGIREGQALKIAESLQKDKFELDKSNANAQTHKVEPKETLYAIARKYNLKVEDLIAANPSLTPENVKTGQILRIPSKIEIPTEKLISSDDYLFHEVQAKETLFSLAKQYNTSVNEIVALNDTSIISGLKVGQKIKVPREKGFKPQTEKTESSTNNNIAKEPEIDSKSSNCLSTSKWNKHNTYNIGIMLPFFSQVSERKDASDASPEEGEVKGNEPVSSNFLEFYEGFLLAASSLKDSGISVNVYSFDTERNTNRVVSLLQKPEFEKLDLIVGPLLPENIRIASEFAKKNKIPLVSPLSARGEFVKSNPYVYQLNPSAEVTQLQLTKYLVRPGKRTIIIIHAIDAKDVDKCTNLRKLIKQQSNNDIDVKLISASQAFIPSLSASHENIIVMTSTDELFVTNTLRKVYDASRNHNITVIGNPAWQRMRNLDQEILHRIGLEFCSPFFTDYNSEKVKSFILKFKSVYGYEPYSQSSFGFVYGMYGYDVGMQFIQSLDKFGRDFGGCINTIQSDPIVSNFYFTNESGSGAVNQAVSIIKYNADYTISRKLVILK